MGAAARVIPLFSDLPATGQGFIRFWYRYPKKIARLEALRAWNRLSEADQAACLERLPAFVAWWELSATPRRYIPHASTFLNGRRWEDEIGDMDRPISNLGRCHWNINGTREPGRGQCEESATVQTLQGNCYCSRHGRSLGLLRR